MWLWSVNAFVSVVGLAAAMAIARLRALHWTTASRAIPYLQPQRIATKLAKRH
jgi:hypothetical protein